MLRNHASGPTSKGAVCLPSSNSRYCLRQRSRLHADRSSQLEVRANNSDESLRLHFPGTERRLKPRSNRRPFLLVLRWKRRKELSQIFLNGFRDSRPRFAGEGCSNPEHVGTVLGDVLAFSFFPFCGGLRQIDVCARLERNQRCRIRERKIVFFVVLVSDECIVIVVQQNCRKAGGIFVKLYRNNLLPFAEIDIGWLSTENLNHRRISFVLRLVEAVELPAVVRSESALVVPGFDEFPESLDKRGVQSLHNQHHVQVIRCPKLQALRGQPLMASYAADEHECFPVIRKVLAEKIKPSNHCGSLSIKKPISFWTRSSPDLRRLRYREHGSATPFSASAQGSYFHDSIRASASSGPPHPRSPPFSKAATNSRSRMA